MKIGIAITTYSNENTSIERINLIKESLLSFKCVNIDDIYIIDDFSTNNTHIKIINDINFNTIRRKNNGGIAKAKNTAIKTLYDIGCDVMFICDDDIIIKKDFVKEYVDVIKNTNTQHYNYIAKQLNPNFETFKYGEYIFNKSTLLNGCMMTITREMVDTIGYFKVLPNKYGHEHTEYTLRAIRNNFASGFIDIINSEEYIIPHIDSYLYKSEPGIDDINKINENASVAFSDEINYIPCKL